MPSPHLGDQRTYPDGRRGSVTVDGYGFALSNWSGQSRTPLHNALVNKLAYYMRGAGHAKVEPRDLLLADHGQVRVPPRGPAQWRPHQQTSIIPDIVYSKDCLMTPANQRLFDVKTLGGGANNYSHSGPPEKPTKAKATDLRASKVADEYRNKAKRIDHHLDPELPPHEPGPLERTIERLGSVEGLCFGFYAEASKSTHKLVQDLAEQMVENSGAQRPEEQICDPAVERYKSIMRRNLGLVCSFGWAQLKLQALFRIRSKHMPIIGMQIQEEAEQDAELSDNPEGNLPGLGMAQPEGE